MQNKLIRARARYWAILLGVCAFASACGQSPRAHSQLAEQKSSVTIKGVEIVEQNLSPKTLEEWKDTGNSKLPVFDVVMRLQNISASSIQDADFIALTTIEFVIAPTYLYQGDATKILQHGNWTRLISVDDVKMETVPYVKSGDVVELRFRGFNLNDILTEYNGQDHTLWPWGLRVSVHVMNREMTRVTYGQATLRIIPADSRLPAK